MSSSLILRTFIDPLAQSVEHNTFNVGVLGSSPKRITFEPVFLGAIAQLVEQRTENPCVPGSIPGGTTNGRLDEWLSLWSAKPATAVRVRYRPLFLYWSLSLVGSERLPYKQRVGGSNPSATTIKMITVIFFRLSFNG